MKMNKVILIGRVTKDLELKATEKGTQYLQFDVAVDNGKDKDGNKREADFINCVAWEKQAETLSVYVKKGHKVAIEGSIKTDKYQNDKGENRYKTYVLVRGFEFLESKPKENYTPNEPDYINQAPKQEEVDPFQQMADSINDIPDSDLPF